MKYARVRFRPFSGLDLSTAKIRMEEGAAQASENFDYEKPPGARVRAGYARLRAFGSSLGIQASAQPSHMVAFERDDDAVRIVIADTSKLTEAQPGTPEWTT